MSRTIRHPLAPATDSRRQRGPRYSDTRAAAIREARAIVADSLADIR